MQRSRHILLVEDHAAMRHAVTELIEADDQLDVLAAVESAEEALELLGSRRPDLAVVDLNLPGMHGLELVSRLDRLMPDVPIVVLSSHASERFGPVARDAGARAYIEKIRTTSDLIKTVRAILHLPSTDRGRHDHPAVPPRTAAPADPETSYEAGHPRDDDWPKAN